MNKQFLGIVAAVVLLAGILLYQASMGGTSLVLPPSDLLAESKISRQRIRVAGRVADLPVNSKSEAPFELRFHIEDPEDPKGSVPVVYRGLKPDMFATGRDVIIQGQYQEGILQAKSLLTQCPSKYEPPKPTRELYTESQQKS